jgi:polyisoprenoid-binding protein YceI
MKKRHSIFLALSFLVFSAFTTYDYITWSIAKDYKIRFSGSGAQGTFDNLQGEVRFNQNDVSQSMMDVSVDVNTIDTGNSLKDKHARSDDWFDAEQFPKIKFRSTTFAKKVNGYSVTGDLTLHGTTKRVTIPFTFEITAQGGTFVGGLTINREDYGIEGPWLRGAFVGEEFEIDLRVPVKK